MCLIHVIIEIEPCEVPRLKAIYAIERNVIDSLIRDGTFCDRGAVYKCQSGLLTPAPTSRESNWV